MLKHCCWLWAGFSLLGLLGCSEEPPQVVHYKIPKQALVDAENNVPSAHGRDPAGGDSTGEDATDGDASGAAAGPKDRMLAAMIPRAGQAWFFKVAGPTDVVAEQSDNFYKLIQSVQFDGDEPKWTLPQGWRQLPGSGLRYATIQFGPKEAPLELTVIPLGQEPGDDAEYALSNVNRWREQLGLPALAAADLATQTQQLKVAGSTVTLVNLEGKLKKSGGMAPFANGPFAPGGAGR